MSDAPAEHMTGAEWLARTIHATGTTHVFWIDAVLRRTLIELGVLGVTRVLAHTEKSAVYMADGYARIAGRPGICFAQSVGAANLAAGLQDPYLGRSPVIALTGRAGSRKENRARGEIEVGGRRDAVQAAVRPLDHDARVVDVGEQLDGGCRDPVEHVVEVTGGQALGQAASGIDQSFVGVESHGASIEVMRPQAVPA